MSLRSVILLACIFFNPVTAYCQDFRILHWGIEQGLSQGINNKIIRDSKGFIWITSYEGVNRFDGKNFQNFYSSSQKNSIRGTETTGLVQDSLHKIWIGSGDGLNRYNAVTDSIMHFFPEQATFEKSRYSIPLIAWKKEVICFEIGGKIVGYNISTFAKRLITTQIKWFTNYTNATNCALDKKNNNLWIPAEQGLAKIDLITGATILYFTNIRVNALLFDEAKNSLFIGTNAGLLLWDITTVKPQKYALPYPAAPGKITCLAKSNDDQIWIGTEEHGLFAIRPGKSLIHLVKTDAKNSINGNKINSIFCESNGITWIGVGTNGIDQLIPGNRFTHYSENTSVANRLSSNIVRCFMEDDKKNIWIATQGGGINIFNPSTQKFVSLTKKNLPGLPFDFVRFMVRDETNTAWIGTEKGMCRINMQTLQTSNLVFTSKTGQPFPDPYIEQMIAFENNAWLIATKEYGLFLLNKSATTATQLSYPGNKHVFYTAFVNGLLFVSIWDDAPEIFSIEKSQWKELKKDLTTLTITYVLYDEQNKKYWIGTLKGLIEADEQLNILRHYTLEDGLGNHYIYAMVLDKEGLLWISTNKGLSQFNPVTKTFKLFTPADGLQGYEYNAKAGFKSSDGSIYFGGTNGFDVIHNSQALLRSEPSVFYIKQLLVNNLPFDPGKNINYTSALNLPYSGNNITIQTGVIDFMTRGNYKIKYKLEGIDKDWRVAERDFTINFSGLPPGNYKFMAMAANADNVWTSNTTSLIISVAKPWWQTWWFKMGIGVLGIGILGIGIRTYYRRKLEKQKLMLEKQQAVEKERTRIATDIHDDLGSGLSRIRYLGETVRYKTMQQENTLPDIEKISLFSDEMVDKMNEIVWALNEKNDTLESMVSYIRSFAVEYLSANNLQCHTDLPDEIPYYIIKGETRRNIFLSVKEILHNIVKHAEATEASLTIAVNRQMIIHIKDNGKGINWEKIRPFSNGMMNIKKRMKETGGTVEFNNEKGTIVILKAPLL